MARERFGNDQPVSAGQRIMAVADATCQARSAIYEAASQALLEADERVLVRNRAAVERLIRIQRSAALRASAIIRQMPTEPTDRSVR